MMALYANKIANKFIAMPPINISKPKRTKYSAIYSNSSAPMLSQRTICILDKQCLVRKQ